jgi:hypothetical protein
MAQAKPASTKKEAASMTGWRLFIINTFLRIEIKTLPAIIRRESMSIIYS